MNRINAYFLSLILTSAWLVGCAETSVPAFRKPTPSFPPTPTATQRPMPKAQTIYVFAKPDVRPDQIRQYVEYLGCRIVDEQPDKGALYVVAVLPPMNANDVLAKFQSHPWIQSATLQK